MNYDQRGDEASHLETGIDSVSPVFEVYDTRNRVPLWLPRCLVIHVVVLVLYSSSFPDVIVRTQNVETLVVFTGWDKEETRPFVPVSRWSTEVWSPRSILCPTGQCPLKSIYYKNHIHIGFIVYPIWIFFFFLNSKWTLVYIWWVGPKNKRFKPLGRKLGTMVKTYGEGHRNSTKTKVPWHGHQEENVRTRIRRFRWNGLLYLSTVRILKRRKWTGVLPGNDSWLLTTRVHILSGRKNGTQIDHPSPTSRGDTFTRVVTCELTELGEWTGRRKWGNGQRGPSWR